MRIIKIGGSLAGSAELPRWLDVIATADVGKIVLVPGGGPWADEVREAQKREGFDDRVAHRRALRAMEKYGKMLAQMRAGLVPAGSMAQINAALHDGRIPVWMPHDMVVAESSIRESWDVTSDSLAAWLATRLNAAMLLLVKSLKIDGPQPGIEDLVRRGWVDPAFAEFAATGYLRIILLGKGDQALAEGLLTAKCEAAATNHD